MDPLAQLIGASPAMVAVRETVRRVLERQSDLRRVPPILILGETGTGKGLLARALHRAGPRAEGPFVDVNCAAIPETMLEAEMFGFERGAFTDARQAKPGLFQAAHRGTLFLDEVGLLPAALQGKLLKAIEERAVRRLGSTRSEPADVWILSATSVDLLAATRERRFREDLYHRLALLPVSLPPLRDRGDDILLLAEHFLTAACADYGVPSRVLGPDARAALRAHPWPGNVRELANVMERVALLSDEASVSAEALGLAEAPGARPGPPARSDPPAPTERPGPLSAAVDEVERAHLRAALERTGWNITRAADDLGVSRDTLRYRIVKHGLRAGDAAPVRPARRRPAATPALPAGRAPAPAPPLRAVRWDERLVALLRVELIGASLSDRSPRLGRELHALVEKVQGFGGRVEELGESGLGAVFGLEPIEDAPRRAAHAAIAIQRAAGRPEPGDSDLAGAQIAIHVRTLPVAASSSVVAIERAAGRRAWSIAEAMLEAAAPDAILVCEAAVPHLRRRFELVPAGSMPGAPGQVYRLVGHERSGFEVGPRMAAFTGRSGELGALRAGLASALDGGGQVIGIAGEAGIGKSRLLWEFRQSLGDAPVTYLESLCLSHAAAIPYAPLIGILRQAVGVTESDPPARLADATQAALDAAGLEPAAAPYLLHLLGGEDGAARLAALSPETIKIRTFDALRKLCLGASRSRTVVLVVEDLHWIDRTSEEWLASLVRELPRAPILLVSTWRSGYEPPWKDSPAAIRVALEPLSPGDSRSLLESLLEGPVPEEVAGLILDKAEGNPFFLEELSHVLTEPGAPGAPRALPDTIQGVLRARIDRLDEAPRRLLQTAAILGRSAPLPLLRAIWEDPEAPEPHLRELGGLDFLREEAGGGEAVHIFKHALVQEVAYEGLPLPRRRALHAAAGRALESLHAGRLDEVADRLAYHYSRAEEAEKAVTYLTRVADRAARVYAHAEALAALAEALGHLDRHPVEDPDRRILSLVLRQAQSLYVLGRFPDILALLARHRERVERLDDPAQTGPYHFRLAHTHGFLGHAALTVEHARRALAEAERCGDEETMGKACYVLAYGCFWSGRPAEGVELARAAIAHLGRTAEQWWLGHAWWVLGVNHAMLGQFDEALEAEARMLGIGEAIGDQRLQSVAATDRGAFQVMRGDFEAGLEACRRGLALAPDPVSATLSTGVLGGAHVEMGDFAQGIPLLERAVQAYQRFRVRQLEGWFTALLAEAHLQGGALDRARALATEGLRITSEIGYRYGVGWAQRVLGRIALAAGDLAEAERRLGEAHETFAATGSRHDVARTHLEQARLAHARHDRAGAEVHLGKALAGFTALGMPRYAERARQLALDLGIPLADPPGDGQSR